MCVAILVESKIGPTADDLMAMEDSNPHGAGIAWPEGDVIRYLKGLRWPAIHRMLARVPRPCLVHFRWATRGPRQPHLAHPFPLGPKALLSRSIQGTAPAVLIHNGTWQNWNKYLPRGINEKSTSDTAVAAYAAGVLGEDVLDDVAWATAVGRASGGGRMDVTLRGTWEEYRGDVYSNTLWRHRSRFEPSMVTPLDPRWLPDGRLATAPGSAPRTGVSAAGEDRPVSVWLDEFRAEIEAMDK